MNSRLPEAEYTSEQLVALGACVEQIDAILLHGVEHGSVYMDGVEYEYEQPGIAVRVLEGIDYTQTVVPFFKTVVVDYADRDGRRVNEIFEFGGYSHQKPRKHMSVNYVRDSNEVPMNNHDLTMLASFLQLVRTSAEQQPLE